MAHKSDQDIIQHTHNTARWFTEHQQVALVLLLGTFLWGWFGYQKMPKRKDPVIPVRVAVAGTPWPGASAEQVEQLVSRPIEQTMAQNAYLQSPSASDYAIRSISFPGLSLVYVQLGDTVSDTRKQFSDINLKLNAMNQNLPQGAGPIQFNGDFGDTAALMLTVASPPADDVAIALRARSVRQTIREVRAALPARSPQPRVSVVYCFPLDVSADFVRENFSAMAEIATREGVISDSHPFQGAGYIGLDATSTMDDAALLQWGQRFLSDRQHASEIHPDAWGPALIRDPKKTAKPIGGGGGRQIFVSPVGRLHRFDRALIARRFRSGQGHSIRRVAGADLLEYSQERLAQYGAALGA